MPITMLNKPVGGRITDIDVTEVLERDEAWSSLSEEKRKKIYSMLPPADKGEDIDVSTHPLRHPVYGVAITNFVNYHKEMANKGFAKKAWLEEAKEATVARAKGHYDSAKEKDREDYWGQKATPAAAPAVAPAVGPVAAPAAALAAATPAAGTPAVAPATAGVPPASASNWTPCPRLPAGHNTNPVASTVQPTVQPTAHLTAISTRRLIRHPMF
ncbi:hypothetical protein B9Z65_2274 [Elsinoe australis]|uniref:ASX DEUBAD domain-containing protein n=1 Tax=Elsinoe australis TaxID=40998 RepID=A0A2P7ZAA1_9PEZI|nr:hypothetical protein B9Z65_2274 [Elsinoe australis]